MTDPEKEKGLSPARRGGVLRKRREKEKEKKAPDEFSEEILEGISVSGGIKGPLTAYETTGTGEIPEPGHHITAGNVGLTDQRGALKPFVLPKGFSSRGYRLLKDITGEMRWENEGESETKGPYVATVGLPGGSEYGDGSSEKTALLDLLVTLGESRKSLEAREATLGEESLEDLTELRLMVEEER